MLVSDPATTCRIGRFSRLRAMQPRPDALFCAFVSLAPPCQIFTMRPRCTPRVFSCALPALCVTYHSPRSSLTSYLLPPHFYASSCGLFLLASHFVSSLCPSLLALHTSRVTSLACPGFRRNCTYQRLHRWSLHSCANEHFSLFLRLPPPSVGCLFTFRFFVIRLCLVPYAPAILRLILVRSFSVFVFALCTTLSPSIVLVLLLPHQSLKKGALDYLDALCLGLHGNNPIRVKVGLFAVPARSSTLHLTSSDLSTFCTISYLVKRSYSLSMLKIILICA